MTELVSHLEMLRLNHGRPLKRSVRSSTRDTSHPEIGPCVAFAATASRTHSSTASFSFVRSAKAPAGSSLADADLILLAREMPRVVFGRDPFGLLGALKHVEVRAAVPVVYEGTELFGGVTGSFVHEGASGEGALFLLPPLDGKDEELLSTRIRNAIGEKSEGAALNATLAKHGFGEDSFGRLLEVATNEAVDEMVASGRARGEFVAS